jgi:hypothetical protein
MRQIGGLQFQQLGLHFAPHLSVDVFSGVTVPVANMLAKSKYKTLAQDETIQALAEEWRERPVGLFLKHLKETGRQEYKQFLNPHGDKTYTQFVLSAPSSGKLKGVYAYFVDDSLKYVGRCKDTMRRRVDNGYGKIDPYNCMKSGQSTNCRINSLIAQQQDSVSLWLCPMTNNSIIERAESVLIGTLQPEWNSQSGKRFL